MKYLEFVGLYEKLAGTTKKLEKTALVAEFLPKLKDHEEWIYLLRGRAFPEYDIREFGVSTQLTLKAIAKAVGVSNEKVSEKFNKIGDMGDVAAELIEKKRQSALFKSTLSADHVFTQLQKLPTLQGAGTVDKKLDLAVELLHAATASEAKYLIRTLIGDLRVGVADATILDAIVLAFFPEQDEMKDVVKKAYDLTTDFATVLKLAFKGKSHFSGIELNTGHPLNVMLAVKAENFEDGFRICGKPVAIEHKYDGFRVVISFDGKTVRLFTRRLEEVTKQFPDIVAFVRAHVKAKNFILDSEAVGFDFKTHKYLPFEAVSQRIKRKHGIDELSKTLPVELNVFDILYLNGKNTIDLPFHERRKILERVIEEQPWKIRLAKQMIVSDVKEMEKFYHEAVKIGEEGIMIKRLDAPYHPGRAVGYMAKLKPVAADLDLVIVGAEYGTGKRAGGLTSFNVACRHNGDFLEVGMVSSGLKEKESEGTSFKEIDALLQPLIVGKEGNSVRVKPRVIVSVTYQNIQPSPSYSSGYALRFPRISHYRPERGTKDIATLDDIKREANKSKK